MLKQPNLSARIGVMSLFLGGAGAILKVSKPNLSARIGVTSCREVLAPC